MPQRHYETPAFHRRQYFLLARLTAEITEELTYSKESAAHVICEREGSMFDGYKFDKEVCRVGRALRGEPEVR